MLYFLDTTPCSWYDNQSCICDSKFTGEDAINLHYRDIKINKFAREDAINLHYRNIKI